MRSCKAGDDSPTSTRNLSGPLNNGAHGKSLLPDANRQRETKLLLNIVHSVRSFGVLALLSVLIAGPAFSIVRLLEPGPILPPPAFCFSRMQRSSYYSRLDPRRQQFEKCNTVGYCRAFTVLRFAAAIFSEPDQVRLLFEQLFKQHWDTPAVGGNHPAGARDSLQAAMSDWRAPKTPIERRARWEA